MNPFFAILFVGFLAQADVKPASSCAQFAKKLMAAHGLSGLPVSDGIDFTGKDKTHFILNSPPQKSGWNISMAWFPDGPTDKLKYAKKYMTFEFDPNCKPVRVTTRVLKNHQKYPHVFNDNTDCDSLAKLDPKCGAPVSSDLGSDAEVEGADLVIRNAFCCNSTLVRDFFESAQPARASNNSSQAPPPATAPAQEPAVPPDAGR